MYRNYLCKINNTYRLSIVDQMMPLLHKFALREYLQQYNFIYYQQNVMFVLSPRPNVAQSWNLHQMKSIRSLTGMVCCWVFCSWSNMPTFCSHVIVPYLLLLLTLDPAMSHLMSTKQQIYYLIHMHKHSTVISSLSLSLLLTLIIVMDTIITNLKSGELGT